MSGEHPSEYPVLGRERHRILLPRCLTHHAAPVRPEFLDKEEYQPQESP
jgi:hypothetical protein